MPVSQLNRENDIEPSESTTCTAKVDWWDVTSRLADGDSEAFETYYHHSFDLMYRQAKRLSGRDEATCLDIVQEAMLKAIRFAKPIASWPRLAAWSKTVVRSAAYDWLRREFSQRRTTESSESHDLIDSDSLQIDGQDELQARLVWIREKLQTVEPELRQLIAMRYRAGWTLSRIGRSVGMKTGAVDGRIRRAIESLKKQAEMEYDDE